MAQCCEFSFRDKYQHKTFLSDLYQRVMFYIKKGIEISEQCAVLTTNMFSTN